MRSIRKRKKERRKMKGNNKERKDWMKLSINEWINEWMNKNKKKQKEWDKIGRRYNGKERKITKENEKHKRKIRESIFHTKKIICSLMNVSVGDNFHQTWTCSYYPYPLQPFLHLILSFSSSPPYPYFDIFFLYYLNFPSFNILTI